MTLPKSRFLSGVQCQKRLWYETNQRDEVPPWDAATLAIFDQGHAVGDIAGRLYPEGVEASSSVVGMLLGMGRSYMARSVLSRHISTFFGAIRA